MSRFRMIFPGARARRLRLTRGLTVKQVAEQVGRSPNTIRAYELRDVMPAPPVRAAMERLYGLEPGDLLPPEEEAADA